jgi:hypothetical protein
VKACDEPAGVPRTQFTMAEILPWQTRPFRWATVVLNVAWLFMLFGIFVFPQTLSVLWGWSIGLVMLQATVPILSILVLVYGQPPRR